MHFLDVDTLERIFRGDALVTQRLHQTPLEQIWLSSITSEEMLGGSLSQINRTRDHSRHGDIELPSRLFVRLIERLRDYNILPYTNAAEEVYRAYDASIKRIGKMDCRLAAHASVVNFTVITCNTADFKKIPGLRVEDWSRS